MLFNSWSFIIFFTVVFVLHFALHQKWRIYLLLVASYYFYMSWRWEFGLLMLAVSLVNFYAGRQIGLNKNRGWWMFLTSVASVMPILYYKYGNFILSAAKDSASMLGATVHFPELDIILPVGISFFTFQALSYSIDIYRKKIEPEPSLVKFLTFIAFFPQLVAGPIERSDNIIPQFDKVKKFNLDEFIAGGRLFIWGLFKKVVIADRLSLYVDPVFDNPHDFSGPTFIVATLLFTFQIYCDFSGYTDMAIGIARSMGFKLMQNFNLPYLAKSIGDFWRRWHISLSSWFGDYLYVPLGGNRVGIPRWIFNIVLVFLVSGLWHGANWTFIIWGALHAGFYLLEYLGDLLLTFTKTSIWKKNRLYILLKIPVTFAMVSFAWIFFRANSVSDACYISSHLFQWSGNLWMGASSFTTILGIFFVFLLMVVQVMQSNQKLGLYYSPATVPNWMIGAAYLVLLLLISLFGVSASAFIYFQF